VGPRLAALLDGADPGPDATVAGDAVRVIVQGPPIGPDAEGAGSPGARIDALERAHEALRDAVRDAAEWLRADGHEVPTVSVGSTPTALAAEHLDGVTEMRPGNYVFLDLYQAGLGVCDVEDVALTVLATVIGHRDRDGAPIVDAGSLALSEDRSTRAFDDGRDKAYGWSPTSTASRWTTRCSSAGPARSTGCWAGARASRRTCASGTGCASTRATPASRRRATRGTSSPTGARSSTAGRA
jgi:hypothetical protein